MKKIPLIVIVGPTASGKTGLAVALAKKYNGEIISADSMQIYKHMDIGTAKPTKEEMQNIPHHMIDFFEPSKNFSVAEYVPLAKACIQEVYGRGKQPILVGGTGLYIDSLLNNVQFGEMQIDVAFRAYLDELYNEKGNEYVYNLLNEIDPECAQNIHYNNRGRVIRALEVYRLTGMKMSDYQKLAISKSSDYDTLIIGLCVKDRSYLYDRIHTRIDDMMEQGLLQETKFLLDHNFCSTAVQAIGYKELFAYFTQNKPLEECITMLKQQTRRYAKRQLTWFRRNQNIHWIAIDIEQDSMAVSEHIIDQNGVFKKILESTY
ncbi:MAG: tRNA (adenosine(37)-N6)-dimethylallyltransferase MiaA [Oscillospiraceae bacterium]